MTEPYITQKTKAALAYALGEGLLHSDLSHKEQVRLANAFLAECLALPESKDCQTCIHYHNAGGRGECDALVIGADGCLRLTSHPHVGDIPLIAFDLFGCVLWECLALPESED